jgi:transcriptional regulator with XRE-family HTH domain
MSSIIFKVFEYNTLDISILLVILYVRGEKMVLSSKLKEARKNAKLTQGSVSSLTGFSNTTISNWETGVSRPDVDSLALLCRVYRVNPNELLEWDNEPQGYYLDPETAAIAQEMHDNPDLRILFDASRKATPEDLKKIRDMAQIIIGNDDEPC